MEKNNRLEHLNIARGFAIVLVVIAHTCVSENCFYDTPAGVSIDASRVCPV